MIWLLLLGLLLVFMPTLWVRWVMKRYASDIADMPGTGGELAKHLIDRFELKGVEAEITELGDHYDPQSKMVRLSEENWHGKSLTAVAIAAHEVGPLRRRRSAPALMGAGARCHSGGCCTDAAPATPPAFEG